MTAASRRIIMESGEVRIGRFMWRATAAHMIAYFLAGLFALIFMRYRELFGSGLLGEYMRPIDSPVTALGPLLQVFMGLALSLILYPFRGDFLGERGGWAKLLLLIGGLSIFAPQVPGPGSFEGVLYTKLSLADHLAGLPETLAYSLLFPTFLCGWSARPRKAWDIIAGIAVGLIAIFSLLGYLSSLGMLPTR
jgi:hypothetical protein